jgi:hypothetical protein
MRRLVAAVALMAMPGPLAAQGAGEGTPWQFSNLQQGYCITFLVNPEDARRLLPEDAQPVRLNAMTDAHPVLARVMADQPEYGSWMPAAVCIYRFARADLAGRQLIAPAGGSEMVGVIAYAARVTISQPANGLSVSVLFSNDRTVVKATDSTAVTIRLIKASFGKAAHSDDEHHVIELGNTKLVWDGHAANDSVPVSEPLEQVWVVKGPRGKPLLLRWKLTARSSRSMVGALVIQGKDKLAKVMRQSPIRYLGPIYQGGIGELTPIAE